MTFKKYILFTSCFVLSLGTANAGRLDEVIGELDKGHTYTKVGYEFNERSNNELELTPTQKSTHTTFTESVRHAAKDYKVSAFGEGPTRGKLYDLQFSYWEPSEGTTLETKHTHQPTFILWSFKP